MKDQKISSLDELKCILSQEWYSVMKNEFMNNYWNDIIHVLNHCNYLPKKKDLFNALNSCPPNKVKVVIIGQDPYIHSYEAHGYSFSVPKGVNAPPSLKNIFKELGIEYNIELMPEDGCLINWANDGVLLLNSILTVEELKSRSHKNIGWERFTSAIIRYIDLHCKCVFLAWGKDAQAITDKQVSNNKVLVAGHPSPLNTARPFVGCGCFKEANQILKSMGILPVRWLSIFNV